MTQKKYVLKIDKDEKLDMILIGICSGMKAYRLCYYLNEKLELNFERQEDYELILGRNNSSAGFVRYLYLSDDEQAFNLFSNRSNEQYLIPELKNIDYLLTISPASYVDVPFFMDHIKKIEMVQSVFDIDISKLKSRFNLQI